MQPTINALNSDVLKEYLNTEVLCGWLNGPLPKELLSEFTAAKLRSFLNKVNQENGG